MRCPYWLERRNRAEARETRARGQAPHSPPDRRQRIFALSARAQGIQLGPAAGRIRQANSSPVVDLPSMTMGIQPYDRERQLEPGGPREHRVSTASLARVRSATSPACAERHRCATLWSEPVLFPFLHRSSSSLFVKPGIDLRHQDRPKGKLPRLDLSRQSAEVAAGRSDRRSPL